MIISSYSSEDDYKFYKESEDIIKDALANHYTLDDTEKLQVKFDNLCKKWIALKEVLPISENPETNQIGVIKRIIVRKANDHKLRVAVELDDTFEIVPIRNSDWSYHYIGIKKETS
jgi:hypothetical protein